MSSDRSTELHESFVHALTAEYALLMGHRMGEPSSGRHQPDDSH